MVKREFEVKLKNGDGYSISTKPLLGSPNLANRRLAMKLAVEGDVLVLTPMLPKQTEAPKKAKLQNQIENWLAQCAKNPINGTSLSELSTALSNQQSCWKLCSVQCLLGEVLLLFINKGIADPNAEIEHPIALVHVDLTDVATCDRIQVRKVKKDGSQSDFYTICWDSLKSETCIVACLRWGKQKIALRQCGNDVILCFGSSLC